MARKLERIEARRLYCEELKEIAEISRDLNVPEATLYRWKADDEADWDKEREEVRMTSFSVTKQMLQAVTERMTSMLSEIKRDKKINSSEVYALRQLLLSVKAMQRDVDERGNLVLWGTKFTTFLQEEDPELLEKLIPHLQKFGKSMLRDIRKRSI